MGGKGQAGFGAAGIWVDEHVGELSFVHVLFALPLIAVATFLIMFAGAAQWLVLARFWVPREIGAGFFLISRSRAGRSKSRAVHACCTHEPPFASRN